jgi:hypothetical protein
MHRSPAQVEVNARKFKAPSSHVSAVPLLALADVFKTMGARVLGLTPRPSIAVAESQSQLT